MTIFIQKGDGPLSVRQATKRGLSYFEAQKMQFVREEGLLKGDQAYVEWANQWLNDNVENAANNLFNHQLTAYRASVARLERYRPADGRVEITEEQETGAFDPETGEAITETVVTAEAVDPLPATIERQVFDPETGESAGVETVPDPAITADDAERTAAQAVIDATPQEVRDFASPATP